MGQYGTMIADSATVGLAMANRLVVGIADDRFARWARPGGQTIVSNHPAFALGHLCLYPLKVHQLLGQAVNAVQPLANYEALFSKDARCEDDAAGTLYPPRTEIVDFFNRSYQAAIETLRQTDDARLIAENPLDTPMKKMCPSLGSLLNFYMTGHVTTHLGQISAWRRMEGMPAA